MRTHIYVIRLGLSITVLLILLAAQQAWARTTIITSLPYTASQTGSAYSETLMVAGTCLTGGGNGIYFTGHDIVLNLGSDTLRFGTGGGGNYGLNFNNAHHIIIEGGWIIHGTSNNMSSNGAVGVQFNGYPHDILLHDTNVIVSGNNAHCVDSYGRGIGTYNIEIDGGRYWDYGGGYTSRCSYDGAALRFESATANGSFNIKIHNIRLMTGPGQGIVIMGRSSSLARDIVYACSLSTDHRNEMYPYDDDNVCHNSANPYLIHARFVGAGTSIHDNVLRSGTSYGGSRGIMLENALGSSSAYIDVYNNDCDTHEGPNVHYGDDFSNFSLRIRPIDGGSVGYIHVRDNKFIVSGDTLQGTGDYSAQPVGGNYSNFSGGNSHITIERNLFRAYCARGGGGVHSRAFIFDGAIGDPTFIFRYNRMESDQIIFKWGDYNSGGRDLTLSQDTLNWYTPVENGSAAYWVGHLSNSWNCTGNVVTDMVYEGGVSDTNIVFSTGGTGDLAVRRTVTVQVNGRNGLPVIGASVTGVNHYGRTVMSGVTDSTGRAHGTVTYWYESRTGADSTAFNDFTIHASKNQDNSSVDYTVTHNSSPAVVILHNTDGNGGGVDTTPPAPIRDLSGYPWRSDISGNPSQTGNSSISPMDGNE
jgi:hypothetical protein